MCMCHFAFLAPSVAMLASRHLRLRPCAPLPSTTTTGPPCVATATTVARLSTCTSHPSPMSIEDVRERGLLSQFKIGNTEYTLVGCIHNTEESVEDVRTVIETVQPDVVAVELPDPPRGGNYLDITNEPSHWKAQKEHLSKGEYMLAYIEGSHAVTMAGCATKEAIEAVRVAKEHEAMVVYADRANKVTISRMMARQPRQYKMRQVFRLLRDVPNAGHMLISYDEGMEFVKNRTDDGMYFPGSIFMNVVFMIERELCFVAALQGIGEGWSLNEEGRYKKVVGVFGAAHIARISRFWGERFDYFDLLEPFGVSSRSDDIFFEHFGSSVVGNVWCGQPKCRLTLDNETNTVAIDCQEREGNLCKKQDKVIG